MAATKQHPFTQLLSVLFPPRCAHCGVNGEELCRVCLDRMKPIGPERCRRCGKPSLYDVPECPECRGRRLHFTGAAAAWRFEGVARSLVHRLKYSGQRRLAGLMADLTWRHPCLTRLVAGVTLTYVPVHASRRFSRGFNQAELYARALSRRLDLPLEGFLVKAVPTTSQNRLNFSERGKNPGNSFMMKRGVTCETGKVVIVDDVFTTGATVSECARVITSRLGVDVDVWTFARTVRH